MKRKQLLLLIPAAALTCSLLTGCNLLYRVEPTEEAETTAVETAPEEETEAADVTIDSPIVGTWNNTYTADGTTSVLTFNADGTGCETGQSDADDGSRVDFTYTVIEDYVEITVDATTLQYTYVIDGDSIEMTYQGYSVE